MLDVAVGDLDAAALLLGAGTAWSTPRGSVQLRSQDGSVQHAGDNLTDAGEGDEPFVVGRPPEALARQHAVTAAAASFGEAC